MAQPTYREIITAIKKGNTAPVYLLMGEEDYYIDMIQNAVETSVIDEADKDFNFNVFYGVDADLENVIACAQQLPVMVPKRVVILKEAQSMQRAKQQLDKLAPYIKRPNNSTVFVVSFKGESLNATSELMKTAAKSDAVVFKSERIRDYKLPSHVRDYCSAYRISIDERAVNMLCEYIGGPLTKLFGEINKLIQIKGESKQISVSDIERHIGVSKDFNNFELTTAISKRDYKRAISIVKYFKANPKTNPTVVTTSTLFNFFSKLVIAHYLTDKSDESLKENFNLRFPAALADFKESLRNYNAYKAVNAVHAIREFDVRSKGVGSFQNEYDLLQELIFKIFTL